MPAHAGVAACAAVDALAAGRGVAAPAAGAATARAIAASAAMSAFVSMFDAFLRVGWWSFGGQRWAVARWTVAENWLTVCGWPQAAVSACGSAWRPCIAVSPAAWSQIPSVYGA